MKPAIITIDGQQYHGVWFPASNHVNYVKDGLTVMLVNADTIRFRLI